MRRTIPFIILLFTILISCGPSNSVSITNFEPAGEVNNLTTFTIEFSENLAPADQIDKWTDQQFVEFEPAIAGKFKWIDSRTLIFLPMFRLNQFKIIKRR